MTFDWRLAATVVVILLLLFIAAILSLAETALTAASAARIHRLEAEGAKRAIIVNHLISDRESLLGALLLGNNVVNIFASALATSVLIKLAGDAGVAIATVVMTALILIFGEVLPKTYAIAAPERTSMAVAPSIRALVAVLAPIVAAVKVIVRATLRVFGVNIDESAEVLSAHEEIRGQIDLHHQSGEVVKGDRDMLGSILDLSELTVADVMVHRKNLESIDADEPVTAIVQAAMRSPHTRIPLHRESPDNIVGVLHARDLLRAIASSGWRLDTIDIKAIMRKPWFIPDTTPAKEQLNAFLKRRNHIAFVVDEYGTLMGLLTLEDILEEIVGEIEDEYDVASAGIRPQESGVVYVDGSVPIRDLNRAMDWNLPDAEATTVAGLVIHEARMIPEPGQAFSFHGFRFEILRKQRNQITSLRVTKLEPEASAA